VTTTLKAGDPAPDFTLKNDAGMDVTLSDFKGQRVIVYFYPAAMTPGCTTQACDFSDSIDALHASGVEVLGISPDSPEKLATFREHDGLTITLRQDRAGRHPLDVRRRRAGPHRRRALQRQGHGSRRQAAQGPRSVGLRPTKGHHP